MQKMGEHMAGDDCYWIGFGDIHGNVDRLSEIDALAGARSVLISGDLTNNGDARTAGEVLEAVRMINPNVYAQYGNMDLPEVNVFLDAQGLNLHARTRVLDPGDASAPAVGVIGLGASTPTPFGTPSEYPDSQMAAWLENAAEQAQGFPLLILVTHTPPFDTATDRLSFGQHVGSPAVRAFIEKRQPDICLTGHIHESQAVDTIGKTVIVNPGALADGGYARIERTKDKLKITLEHI